MKRNILNQLIPIILTIFTFILLVAFLFIFVHILNIFPLTDKIVPRIHITDVVVGFTIYVKTSVDFALFIGNLMSKNPGMKNRIAIEIGTAIGNAAGTAVVLVIWTFFKEVPFLMILMILLASIVLLQMAEESIENVLRKSKNKSFSLFYVMLRTINRPLSPLTRFILPKTSAKSAATSFVPLLFFSFSIPLILGLDDFAGYIPLFNIVNVFGFATGVFFGHMLLNMALFASPTATIAIVQKPLIAFIGSLAFIGIALWGFVEIFRITSTMHLF